MNDTMSLILATSILAIGGLGLYMFKSSNDNKYGDDDYEYDYDEDGLFDPENWQGEADEESVEEEEEYYKPAKKASKTHRNRKSTGNSRRKY